MQFFPKPLIIEDFVDKQFNWFREDTSRHILEYMYNIIKRGLHVWSARARDW